jgi:predicted ATPase/class 3 adenylate cyclase/Tfp pilus assembly protein PilF
MSLLRSLLLTDVVDSTRMAEALGDAAMAALWIAHDRLARDLLPAWRGREIDKTDGMLLLFEAASDAVGYALAYQRALALLDPPLQARAGLHIGPVLLRENLQSDVALGAKPLEVEGTAKATAARVMSVADGGQILLSAAAREALGDCRLRLQSHGHWRLKGLAEPVELFEVGDADTPFTPPPDAAKAYRVVRQGELWLPVRSIKHTLPAERDGFVGRDQVLLDLSRRLHGGARLVSVLGLGGTGKTRLVTRFGWRWLGDFPGGAWFCDLSQARSLDGITHAVAQGLEVPLGKGDPVAQLGHAIAGRGSCLVILDNFEQVARHAEETLGRWLDRAGDACFLVTTREVLGLAGEEVLALAPLPPGDAAELFLRRAEAAKPGFQPNAGDRAAIDPLVKLLDGLPLAIELAAARVRVMSPRTLLARMNERFKLLASSGGRVDRQATLRAVFDWSWELLSAPEKAALAQLSVFEGGLTLGAAEAVLDLSGFENAPWPMDALQSLVQKSFVRQVGDARFDMLVSVQEYAAEHLRTEGRFAGSGAQAALLAQVRHGAYFSDLGEAAATADSSVELENFIVACRRAIARGDADMATTLLEGAWDGLKQHGPFHVGDELASLVLSMPALGATAMARAQSVAGNALQACGRDAEAYPQFEAALVLSRRMRDRQLEANSLHKLGDLDFRAGRVDAARANLGAAMVVAHELQDRRLETDVHNNLGSLEESLGRIDDARVHYEAALAWAREAGDRRREGGILGNLGLLCIDQGRMGEALMHHEAALGVARETGSLRLASNTQCNLGMLLHLLGRPAQAQSHLEAALSAARTLGHAQTECTVLCNLGIVFESLGRPDQAQAHLEAALSLARRLGDARSQGQFLGYLGLLHARQSRHQEALRNVDAGQALLEAVSDRIGLGVLLCSRAEAAHLAGHTDAALAAFNEAEAIGAEVGAGPDSEIGLSLTRVHALIATPRD